MKALNLEEIKNRIDIINANVSNACLKANRNVSDVQIMAVTKTVAPEMVNFALENGIILLGENRVQEFLEKCPKYHATKQDIHFIGHLQTNKVKYIIDRVTMIESVSSLKLADEIDLKAKQSNIVMPILLEVNIAKEETKDGFLEEDVYDAAALLSQKNNLHIDGLMCIPAKENSKYFFEKMNELFLSIKLKKIPNVDMRYLSMGMSHDYQSAIMCNANIIRLGSAIFGERNFGG